MYLVFQLTFTLGAAPMGWIETGFGWLAQFINGFWPKGSESALQESLLVDGALSVGVGGVVVIFAELIMHAVSGHRRCSRTPATWRGPRS